jgi:hypothetical protein
MPLNIPKYRKLCIFELFIVPEKIRIFLDLDSNTKLQVPDVTKRIYRYINEHKLRDEENRTIANPDDKLRKLFNLNHGETINLYKMNKYVSALYKLENIFDWSESESEEIVEDDEEANEKQTNEEQTNEEQTSEEQTNEEDNEEQQNINYTDYISNRLTIEKEITNHKLNELEIEKEKTKQMQLKTEQMQLESKQLQFETNKLRFEYEKIKLLNKIKDLELEKLQVINKQKDIELAKLNLLNKQKELELALLETKKN